MATPTSWSSTAGTATVIDVGSNPTTAAVADLDDDGDLDVVIGFESIAPVAVFADPTNGTYTVDSVITPLRGGSTFQNVWVTPDLTGDGIDDLAAVITTSCFAYGACFVVAPGDGTGHFDLQPPVDADRKRLALTYSQQYETQVKTAIRTLKKEFDVKISDQ